MSKKILGWSLVDALGTLVYIGFVVGFISSAEAIFGPGKSFVIPIAMLLLFVLSASVTGGLVLGRPLIWYWAGEKTGAVKLFAATLAWLAIFFVAIILGVVAWSNIFPDKSDQPNLCYPIPSTNTKPTGGIGLANPASVNCTDKGGKLVIQTRPTGQYGLCYFDDNRACEEWAMMRGECQVGGVKTTGYDTDAQKYCAWVGGRTAAAPNAVCTFDDNSTCAVDALYAGTCVRGAK